MKRYKYIETWIDFMLNETLKSYDIDIVYDTSYEHLSLLNFDFNITKNHDRNLITIKLNNFKNNRDPKLSLGVIKRLMIDRQGWFPSKLKVIIGDSENLYPYDEEEYIFKEEKYLNYDSIEITFESKYDKLSELPNKLYHLSIKHYMDKILEIGIVPRSKSKLSTHVDRIYVCKNPDDCHLLINSMKMYYSNRKYSNNKFDIDDNWIIYEIDTSGLDISLYKDPNYEDRGFYIVDNIPPNKITIYDEE